MLYQEQQTASMLIIGDELLSGRTTDVNFNTAAKLLRKHGIALKEGRIIGDLSEQIIASVNELRKNFDYVFTSGGIGPTHDDITAKAIARAFGAPLKINPQAKKILTDRYKEYGLNQARLKMALMPEKSRLILNPVSQIPGFQINNVFVLAGIPRVMEAMLKQALSSIDEGKTMFSIDIKCHLRESDIAAELEKIADKNPCINIGSYPKIHPDGSFKSLNLVVKSLDKNKAQEIASIIEKIIHSRAPMTKNNDKDQ